MVNKYLFSWITDCKQCGNKQHNQQPFLDSSRIISAPRSGDGEDIFSPGTGLLFPVIAVPLCPLCLSGKLLLLNECSAWLAILSLPTPSCDLRYSLNFCGSIPPLKCSYFHNLAEPRSADSFVWNKNIFLEGSSTSTCFWKWLFIRKSVFAQCSCCHIWEAHK